jgi:hypothetical protein
MIHIDTHRHVWSCGRFNLNLYKGKGRKRAETKQVVPDLQGLENVEGRHLESSNTVQRKV